jgi:hypothetical protein
MSPCIIDKPCIFVTSAGRTATRFISELIELAIPDCYSDQEPDVWRLDSVIVDFKKNYPQFKHKIRDFGLFNMTLGKLTPLGNPRGLSAARQMGKISEVKASKYLFHFRNRFLSKLEYSVYAECNLQVVGLIDLIPKVFPNSKTVFIIRDGRDWVRSSCNGYFAPYSIGDPVRFFPGSRASSKRCLDDPFRYRWESFSRFQKLCWYWRKHAQYALETLPKNPNSKMIKYEKLFDKSRHTEEMTDLLKYLTYFPNGTQLKFKYDGELKTAKFHESRKNTFPKWIEWSQQRVDQFQEICGDVMKQLKYGQEPEWQRKLKVS